MGTTSIFQTADGAFDNLKDHKPPLEGDLNLAVSYTVTAYCLPSLGSRFQRNYPRVQLRLSEAPRPENEQGLLSGRFDLAIALSSNLDTTAPIKASCGLIRYTVAWDCSHHPCCQGKPSAYTTWLTIPASGLR
ncbi:LysR substrate-binding domain-containing protein [Halomonas icarae]|uniref:LysR substrate-binding domain-containing protein n=1 Tax=Halomonas icarae TaxID=2691040 RepID=A0A7X5AMX5_9GAMM|nr:hypothetical protein [Halomonas icarae]